MTEELTGAQRRRLRALAHPRKPVVMVGKQGMTDAVVAAVDAALTAHELVNVKITAERNERERFAADIAERTRSHCAGVVGTKAVFYRPHADPTKRAIRMDEA